MSLITKLLSITCITPEDKKETRVLFLKMSDRAPGKDDLSLCKEDKDLLRKNMSEGYTFVDAHVICTQNSKPLYERKLKF